MSTYPEHILFNGRTLFPLALGIGIERNGMTMTKHDLSSRHFQRKISEFCELRFAPIASRRVLNNTALSSQFDHLPEIACVYEWSYRLDDDRSGLWDRGYGCLLD
ncbi:hypothetical protein DSM25559_5227 [Agrobacterium rosae]|uniref:Uncharacterized protein n=1 Tax=Agrobacterium rosae TaxID=1972867 RepID=A0A1R3U9F6_9HYPH|nr:hypothetical protein DSM25559_5227 [Agrobacterium rosae]